MLVDVTDLGRLELADTDAGRIEDQQSQQIGNRQHRGGRLDVVGAGRLRLRRLLAGQPNLHAVSGRVR